MSVNIALFAVVCLFLGVASAGYDHHKSTSYPPKSHHSSYPPISHSSSYPPKNKNHYHKREAIAEPADAHRGGSSSSSHYSHPPKSHHSSSSSSYPPKNKDQHYHKREALPGAADAYYGPPLKAVADYTPSNGGHGGGSSSSSTSSSSTYSQSYPPSITTFSPALYLTKYVLGLKGKEGGTYEPNKPWKADCNGYPNYGYKHAWLTSLWDDYDFKTVKYAKCVGPKSDYDDGKYSGYSLDLSQEHVIDLDSYKSGSSYNHAECYKGYLMTAIWSKDYDFKDIRYGKCVRMDSGLVDYSTCDNVFTEGKSGGTYEADHRWLVSCPHPEWAIVGIKKSNNSPPSYDSSSTSSKGYSSGAYQGQGYDGSSRIEYIRCCKLIQPHPKYGY